MPRIPRARFLLDVFFVGVALSAAAAFAYRSVPDGGGGPQGPAGAPATAVVSAAALPATGTLPADVSEGRAPARRASPPALLPRTATGVVAARPAPEEDWCGAGPEARSTAPMSAANRRRAVRGEPG